MGSGFRHKEGRDGGINRKKGGTAGLTGKNRRDGGINRQK